MVKEVPDLQKYFVPKRDQVALNEGINKLVIPFMKRTRTSMTITTQGEELPAVRPADELMIRNFG